MALMVPKHFFFGMKSVLQPKKGELILTNLLTGPNLVMTFAYREMDWFYSMLLDWWRKYMVMFIGCIDHEYHTVLETH